MVTGQNLKTSRERLGYSSKSNRVNGTDDRIIAILAHLRGGIVGIYAQKKLDELDKENNTQD